MSNFHRDLQDDQLHAPKGHIDADVDSKIIKNLNSDHEYINESWKSPILDFLDIALTGTHLETNRARYALINLTGSIAHSDWDGASLNDIVEYFSSELEWKSYSPTEGDLVYDKDTNAVFLYDGTDWVAQLDAVAVVNLYTEDGSIDEARLVTLNNTLTFQGSGAIYKVICQGADDLSSSKAFEVKNNSGDLILDPRNNRDLYVGSQFYFQNSNGKFLCGTSGSTRTELYPGEIDIYGSGGTNKTQFVMGATPYMNVTGFTAFEFRMTAVSAVALDATAQVGIGKTGTMSGRLHVLGLGATSATVNQIWQNSTPTTIAQLLDNGFLGIGATTPTAKIHISSNVTASAWGTDGIVLRVAAATYTDSSTVASGTAANAAILAMQTPTLAASNTSVTTTVATTLYIGGAPSAGTNMTITRSWALWIDNGDIRIDANTSLGGKGISQNPNSILEVGGTRSQSAWGKNGIIINTDAVTSDYTDSSTSASGTASLATFISFQQPTLKASNSSVTTTDAATVYIEGNPIASTNQTITNAHALYIAAGNLKLASGQFSIAFQSTLTPSGTTQTIDFNSSNNIILDLGSSSGDVTLTLSNPRNGATYRMKILGHDTLSRNITWPADVRWEGGTAPVISNGTVYDWVELTYDGSVYTGRFWQNYTV